MQTPEQKLDKEIMLECGKRNWLCFHINVGGGLMANGTYFTTGVPKGWSDLIIFTDKGQVLFCETKIHPRKPTEEQLQFIAIMNARGIKSFVAYNLDEFKKNIEGL